MNRPALPPTAVSGLHPAQPATGLPARAPLPPGGGPHQGQPHRGRGPAGVPGPDGPGADGAQRETQHGLWPEGGAAGRRGPAR